MSTLVAQTISNGTVSTSSANVIRGSARAWVNFSNVGTIASSYNVSSVTYDGSAVYTVNFSNAFSVSNYLITQGHGWNGRREWGFQNQSTTSVQIVIGYTSNTSGGGTGAQADFNTHIMCFGN